MHHDAAAAAAAGVVLVARSSSSSSKKNIIIAPTALSSIMMSRPDYGSPAERTHEVRIRVLGLAGIVVDRPRCSDVASTPKRGSNNATPPPPTQFGAVVSFGASAAEIAGSTLVSAPLKRSKADEVRSVDSSMFTGSEEGLERHIALWPQSSASAGRSLDVQDSNVVRFTLPLPCSTDRASPAPMKTLEVLVGLQELGKPPTSDVFTIGVAKLALSAQQARTGKSVLDLPVLSVQHADPPGQYNEPDTATPEERRKKKKGISRLFGGGSSSRYSEEKKSDADPYFGSYLEQVYAINSNDAAMRIELEVIETLGGPGMGRQSTDEFNTGRCLKEMETHSNAFLQQAAAVLDPTLPDPSTASQRQPPTSRNSSVMTSSSTLAAAPPPPSEASGMSASIDMVSHFLDMTMESGIERVLSSDTNDAPSRVLPPPLTLSSSSSPSEIVASTAPSSTTLGMAKMQSMPQSKPSPKSAERKSSITMQPAFALPPSTFTTPLKTSRRRSKSPVKRTSPSEKDTVSPAKLLATAARQSSETSNAVPSPKFAVDVMQDEVDDEEQSACYSIRAIDGDFAASNQPVEVLPRRGNNNGVDDSKTPLRSNQTARPSGTSPMRIGSPLRARHVHNKPKASAELVSSKAQKHAAMHKTGAVITSASSSPGEGRSKRVAVLAAKSKKVRSRSPLKTLSSPRRAMVWSRRNTSDSKRAVDKKDDQQVQPVTPSATPDTSAETATPSPNARKEKTTSFSSHRRSSIKPEAIGEEAILEITKKPSSGKNIDVMRSRTFTGDSTTLPSQAAAGRGNSDGQAHRQNIFGYFGWNTACRPGDNEALQPLALCYAKEAAVVDGEDDESWYTADDNSSVVSRDHNSKAVGRQQVGKFGYCNPMQSPVGPKDLVQEMQIIRKELNAGTFWRTQSNVTQQSDVSAFTQESGALSRRRSRWEHKRAGNPTQNAPIPEEDESEMESDEDDTQMESVDEDTATDYTNDDTEVSDIGGGNGILGAASESRLRSLQNTSNGPNSRDTTLKASQSKHRRRESEDSADTESPSLEFEESTLRSDKQTSFDKSYLSKESPSSVVDRITEPPHNISKPGQAGNRSFSDTILNMIRCEMHAQTDDRIYTLNGVESIIAPIPSRLDPDDKSVGELTQTTHEVRVDAQHMSAKVARARSTASQSRINSGKDLGGFFRCGDPGDLDDGMSMSSSKRDGSYFNEYNEYNILNADTAAAAEAAWSKRKTELAQKHPGAMAAEPLSGRTPAQKTGRFTHRDAGQSYRVEV